LVKATTESAEERPAARGPKIKVAATASASPRIVAPARRRWFGFIPEFTDRTLLPERLSKGETIDFPGLTDSPMKRLASTSVVLSLAGLISAGALAGQQSSTVRSISTRTAAIVAAFSKNKHVVKNKRGVSLEKYKRVESEPVIRSNPETLSGAYEVDAIGSRLTLQISRDGRVSGSGTEVIGEGISRTFTLADGRIEGALLTAVKVFNSGVREMLEGAFLNRTSYERPADSGVSQLGIGVIGAPVTFHGNTHERFFYRRKGTLSSQVVYH
jgi:hypothetical protein